MASNQLTRVDATICYTCLKGILMEIATTTTWQLQIEKDVVKAKDDDEQKYDDDEHKDDNNDKDDAAASRSTR